MPQHATHRDGPGAWVAASLAAVHDPFRGRLRAVRRRQALLMAHDRVDCRSCRSRPPMVRLHFADHAGHGNDAAGGAPIRL